MEKMELMNSLIDDMKSLTNTLEKIINLENVKENNYKGDISKEEKPITLEEVRGILAKKSQLGFTTEVKALINYYGCNKLSEIDSKYYAEILEKAKSFDK